MPDTKLSGADKAEELARERMEKLIIAGVRLAIIRWDLRDDEGDLSDERTKEIAQDAAWACRGEGTCDNEPIEEWSEIAALLRPHLESERWIPVGERLPEDDHWVLVSGSKYVNATIAYHDKESDQWCGFSDWSQATVTHWRPLPDLPTNTCDWCDKPIPQLKSASTGNYCSDYCANTAEFDRKLP